MTKKYAWMRKDRITQGVQFLLHDTYEEAALRYPPPSSEIVTLDVETAEPPYKDPPMLLGDLVVAEDGPEFWDDCGWIKTGKTTFWQVDQELQGFRWVSRDMLPERIKVVKRHPPTVARKSVTKSVILWEIKRQYGDASSRVVITAPRELDWHQFLEFRDHLSSVSEGRYNKVTRYDDCTARFDSEGL